MKLTRRDLVAVAAGSALAVKATAQTSAGGPRDFAKEASDGIRRNAETLAKFAVPISTEPPFHFKA